MTKTRDEALALLHEYTASESLRKHAYAVEGAMRWYAQHLGQDVELWGITGLLHDFDYERYPDPTPAGHPYVGCQMLGDLGYPEEVRTAIMGHAKYTGVQRESQMAKMLFAVDELSGLITAACYVRPDRSVMTIEPSSVKKKMKDKAFARGVDREDITVGAQEIGIDLDTHIANVIQSMRERAELLGLAGNPLS